MYVLHRGPKSQRKAFKPKSDCDLADSQWMSEHITHEVMSRIRPLLHEPLNHVAAGQVRSKVVWPMFMNAGRLGGAVGCQG